MNLLYKNLKYYRMFHDNYIDKDISMFQIDAMVYKNGFCVATILR